VCANKQGLNNPYFYNYDLVCFYCNLGAAEPRLVQLDHQAIAESPHQRPATLEEVLERA
jgi:hypothetical protein